MQLYLLHPLQNLHYPANPLPLEMITKINAYLPVETPPKPLINHQRFSPRPLNLFKRGMKPRTPPPSPKISAVL